MVAPLGGRARGVGSAKSCWTPAELIAVGLDVALLWSFDDQSIPYHLPLKTKALCRLFSFVFRLAAGGSGVWETCCRC